MACMRRLLGRLARLRSPEPRADPWRQHSTAPTPSPSALPHAVLCPAAVRAVFPVAEIPPMRRLLLGVVAVALCTVPVAANAGVTNPDISLIGQPLIHWTDAAGDPSRKRPVLDAGETEIVFDAALNPYARGWATLSFAEGGASVEEIYFTMLRGLPAGLTLKGGKYRMGFGKLNMVHPHAYPFAERFSVLAAYLPGEEAFNETGLQLSARLPAPGDISLTASIDALQGDTFRILRQPSLALNDPLAIDPLNGDRTAEPRTAVLGRLSAFLPVNVRSGVELGLSGTQGTNNAAAATRTTVLGADVKAKLWTGDDSFLLVQAAHPHFIKAGRGRVLNIGSINAYCGEAILMAYAASKGALMALTRNLADAHGREGILVNQINPGWVLTKNEYELQVRAGQPPDWHEHIPPVFAPSGRILKPEEIAHFALALVSEGGGPVSGAVIECEQFPVFGRNPVKS